MTWVKVTYFNSFTIRNINELLNINLNLVSIELWNAIETHNADLLVIEGMGRALHTNFNEKFRCETLKLAVIKNKWWANRLGGDNFSIICKYEYNL